MNKRAIADHVDVSVNTISRWVSLGCAYDMDEKGRYIFDPDDVETWRHDNIDSRTPGEYERPPSTKEIASWSLSFATKLLHYIKACKRCNNAIMKDARLGKFGGKNGT